MARSRKYVQDPRTKKQVDGLSPHKGTGQFYSLDKKGQRIYWGNDLIRAIDDYRTSLNLGPLRQMTDEEALMRLAWDNEPEGIDNDEITSEQIKRTKQNQFVVNNDWLDSNPNHPFAVFIHTGKMPKKRKQEPTPKVNPNGIRTLKQIGPQWATDKRESEDSHKPQTIKDYLSDWDEFVVIARHHRVVDIAQVDKNFIRKYRTKIKIKANGSINYYSNRFRRVKAILRHILTEHDVANLSDERVGYIRDSLSMLGAKVTKAPNRYVTTDELHALLKVCTILSSTDTDELQLRLEKTKNMSTEYQRLAAKIGKVQEQRYLGIQFRAVYLMAVNCMFYPVDLAAIPTTAVNFNNGHVHFRRGKKDIVRVGLLLPTTIEALKAWLAFREDYSDRLFLNTKRTPWNKKSLGRRLQNHRQLAGLPDEPIDENLNKGTLTFKAFRKGGYRAALQDQRVDQYTAKILAGQSTGITDSYVDANPERCRLAVESIGKVYEIV